MKNSNLITTLLAMLALFAGCRKDEPWPLSALPPATQTGARTAGCLINGEPWVAGIFVLNPLANKTRALWDDPEYKGTRNNNTLYLSLSHEVDTSSTMFRFEVAPLLSPRTINQADTIDLFKVQFSIYFPGKSSTYSLDKSKSYNFKITSINKNKRYISGSFSMHLVNIHFPYDTLKVTNGRFDTWYNPE